MKIQTQNLLHWRKTKIVVTLGPSSNTEKVIEKLIRAGADVVRLNMSHGDHSQHRENMKRVRKVAARLNKHVAVLMDLCGPKLRVGRFENGAIQLKEGSTVTVTCRKVMGQTGLIPSQYPQLHKDVAPKHRILLDDGNFELQVKKISGKDIECEVIYGGELRDRKGMNLPDSAVSTAGFTKKDKEDARLAVELGADFIALSFVRSVKDINALNRFLKGLDSDIPIIAKIEKPEALTDIDAILDASYGIMVARGDLGIELPAQKVPLIQRDLIEKARYYNRPVIVATQMLESMISNSRPTRAEVGDVANAALTSADAVMLSAETAAGKYPIKAVKMMDSVLHEIETWQQSHPEPQIKHLEREESDSDDRKAIAHAVTILAKDLALQGIVVPTHSGTTARILAADRPRAPLLGVSSDLGICRRLALHWGVLPIDIKERITHDWHALCVDLSKRCEMPLKNNTILLVSGFNEDPKLNEPAMKLIRVEQ